MRKFELNEKEEKLADQFVKVHYVSCDSARISYIITPTGIGTGVSVQCKCCGALEDISDYDSW